jgi:GNAT superfamily N-acetyltransferase
MNPGESASTIAHPGSTEKSAALGVPFALRDGSRVRIRPCHEAMVALDEHVREGLGVAHYVRSPERAGAAEVAPTVIDDWQGRGLGTLLLEVISARARQEGIKTFTALMLAENRTMRDLLDRLGPVRVIDEERGTVEVEETIRDVGVAPELRELLRISPRHHAGSSRAGGSGS